MDNKIYLNQSINQSIKKNYFDYINFILQSTVCEHPRIYTLAIREKYYFSPKENAPILTSAIMANLGHLTEAFDAECYIDIRKIISKYYTWDIVSHILMKEFLLRGGGEGGGGGDETHALLVKVASNIIKSIG